MTDYIYLFKIIILITIIFIIGIFGYYLSEENWTLIDGLYMTAISIATVGFGEVKPLSDNGRLFTIILVFMGLGSAAVFATQLAKAFLENHFQQYSGVNKIIKKINKISKLYLKKKKADRISKSRMMKP